MKVFKNVANVLIITMFLGVTTPTVAQTVKDTSTTKANGAGAGNGSSQGAPGAATVSGTGTGTLQDSGSTSTGDTGTKAASAIDSPKVNNQASEEGHGLWGLLGLIGLLGLLGLRRNNDTKAS
ncbi:hypothetical protein [Mucilaginibacter pocheonensis]|uniref:MYXO-CTERM domain-containing protein n=1 Tax=Mucilaginibacter pocheonensis TaxID=398050 RepID=A0ABU1TCS2_9SPHI|nr:hypothetical protein [Mucilaginibacter pocheonensis]MDR6943191.1 MYXO-CTERM domain-containing protein [Mucilaginibacter pocheonensis]